ncbi:hypothetical protein HN873_054578, partial [Arachis hypogaea]
EKQGYCNFFVWFDEIFGCLVDDVVESSRLASMETCKGEEFGAGLNYTLEERVKQLEEMLIKRNEDSSKIKKDSVFRINPSLRSSLAGLSIVARLSTFSTRCRLITLA